MTQHKIEITALDTLFFRDGRPFERGDENWAEGIFPPPPSVIYGALRTALLSLKQIKLEDIGEQDPTKELRITDIALCLNKEVWRPCPADLSPMSKEDAKLGRAGLQKIAPQLVSSYPFTYYPVFGGCHFRPAAGEVLTPYPIRHYPVFGGGSELPTGAHIRQSDYEAYLRNADINFSFRHQFTRTEARIGVGIQDTTRTAAEGQLFRVGMLRPVSSNGEPISILVTYTGVEGVPPMLRLGAEGKIAEVHNALLPALPQSEPLGDYFKVILLTPTLFANNVDFADLKTKFPDAKLLSAIVGKTLPIGGWDMKNRKPKPQYAALPPGCVFYFAKAGFTSPLPEALGENTEAGFGQYALANFSISEPTKA